MIISDFPLEINVFHNRLITDNLKKIGYAAFKQFVTQLKYFDHKHPVWGWKTWRPFKSILHWVGEGAMCCGHFNWWIVFHKDRVRAWRDFTSRSRDWGELEQTTIMNELWTIVNSIFNIYYTILETYIVLVELNIKVVF